MAIGAFFFPLINSVKKLLSTSSTFTKNFSANLKKPMVFTPISDLNIPELQIYRHLRDNIVTKDNSFIADSPKVVNMLLEASVKVRSILATEKYFLENKNLRGCYLPSKV